MAGWRGGDQAGRGKRFHLRLRRSESNECRETLEAIIHLVCAALLGRKESRLTRGSHAIRTFKVDSWPTGCSLLECVKLL